MKRVFICFLFPIIIFFGCTNNSAKTDKNKVALTLWAYTVPKEAYQKEIMPAFKKYWKEKTGQEVEFYESYMASGAQSRAISGGFEADIAALSLEKDSNSRWM